MPFWSSLSFFRGFFHSKWSPAVECSFALSLSLPAPDSFALILSAFFLFVRRRIRFRYHVCGKVHKKVPTYYPLVAVKYSFDDDEVINSYYTLWHRRREWSRSESEKESLFLFPPPQCFLLTRGFFSFFESYHEFGLMLFIYFFFFFLLDDNPRMRVRCTQSTSFSSSFFPSTHRLHDNFHTDGRVKKREATIARPKSLCRWRMMVECAA